MNYNNTVRIALACALSSTISLVFAQQSSIDSPTIMVTATRTANTVDQTLAPVTIITAEDISRLQVNSIPQILSKTPGIDVVSPGGYGSNSAIFIRGTNSDHVLTLIDGVRVGSATSGSMALEYLSVDQIERIEIVRGPRSSLYGADAIGGVIQIFTRKGTEKQQAAMEVGYGSDNTSKLSANYSNGNKNSQAAIAASFFNTDGYNFVADKQGDDFGYDNRSISFNASHKISDKIDVNGLFLYHQGNSEFDGSFVNNTDFVEQTLAGQLNLELSQSWDMLFKASQNQSDSENNLDSLQMSYFDSASQHYNWQNELSIADNSLLIIGADYDHDKVESSTEYSETTRSNYALFSQYQLFAESFDLSLSLRHDDNESYGKHNTGNIAIAIPLNKQTNITASYGTAFKAPSFNDLYYPQENYPAYSPGAPTSSYSGNPNLEPETSQSFDLGIKGQYKGQWANQFWAANYFNSTIDNLIEYVSEYNALNNNYDGTMKNITKAKIQGIELSWQAQFDIWSINSNYSWIDAKNDETDFMLPYRSEHLFSIHLDSNQAKFNYGISMQASSERYIDTREEFKLAGFFITDIRLSYQINKQWIIKAKVDNLFDTDYATHARFGLSQRYFAPGRMAMLSINYAPFKN